MSGCMYTLNMKYGDMVFRNCQTKNLSKYKMDLINAIFRSFIFSLYFLQIKHYHTTISLQVWTKPKGSLSPNICIVVYSKQRGSINKYTYIYITPRSMVVLMPPVVV